MVVLALLVVLLQTTMLELYDFLVVESVHNQNNNTS